MKIDPETWFVLSKLLDEWLDLPGECRAAWLESLGPEHSEVLPALRQMIANHAAIEADNFLHTLPTIRLATNASVATKPEVLGERAAGVILGPYRLLKELGQGGMWVVWLAEKARSSRNDHCIQVDRVFGPYGERYGASCTTFRRSIPIGPVKR